MLQPSFLWTLGEGVDLPCNDMSMIKQDESLEKYYIYRKNYFCGIFYSWNCEIKILQTQLPIIKYILVKTLPFK